MDHPGVRGILGRFAEGSLSARGVVQQAWWLQHLDQLFVGPRSQCVRCGCYLQLSGTRARGDKSRDHDLAPEPHRR